jgi:cell wall-associated NlpC family hydrolase
VPALVAGLLALPSLGAAAKPPPNPTDGQLHSAAAQKEALANQVGQLNAQVAAIQTQIQQKQAVAELAEQKYAYAMQKLDEANQAADAAKARVQQAQDDLAREQAQFREQFQSSYADGEIGGTTGSLLTAQNPSVLLEEGALRDYLAEHQMDEVSRVQAATVEKSNADAAARAAVLRQQAATKAAADAKQQADDAVIAAQSQEHELQSSLASTQHELVAAQEQLATLNHQREAFIAYQKHQAWLRHQAWLKHQAELKKARELAAKRAEELRQQREQQQQQEHQHHSGGGSGGGGGSSSGGGGSSHPPVHVSGGGWSSSKGWAAVSRAKQFLGWMYAWAGGNAYGPTRGVCAGDGAWNDCHVTGFDCSGLTLYAWAPYKTLDHYSVTQYYQAGHFHPSTGQLLPGDLVFWSSNGSVSGIHHVALYIGNGMVIQAPQSGSVIQETPLGSVSWGYYGATRPLT